jgi:hypothetical protein
MPGTARLLCSVTSTNLPPSLRYRALPRVALVTVVAGVARHDKVQIFIIAGVGEHRSLERACCSMASAWVSCPTRRAQRRSGRRLPCTGTFGAPVVACQERSGRPSASVPHRSAVPHHAIGGSSPGAAAVLEGDDGVLFRVAEVGRGRWPIGASGQITPRPSCRRLRPNSGGQQKARGTVIAARLGRVSHDHIIARSPRRSRALPALART